MTVRVDIEIRMDQKCPLCGKPGQVRIKDDSAPEGYRPGVCLDCAIKRLTGGKGSRRRRRRTDP